MRILLNTINFYPELTGIGKYSGEMAEWLALNGHNVRVITAPPYYPNWSVQEGYSASKYKHESYGNVEIWRCPLYVPTQPSGLKRILHLLSFTLTSFPILLKNILWRPDVIITIEPPLFCAPSVWLISRTCGAKCWLHVQDFEIDAAFSLGLLKNNLLNWLVRQFEKWLISRFDQVSTISYPMLEKLNQKGVAVHKCNYFPNWVDTSLIFPLKGSNIFREKLLVDNNQIVLLYSGNIGEKQGLEIVIESARRLKNEGRIVFVICGHGGNYSKIKALGSNLSNIKWLPLQPLEKLNSLLNLADVHLLPQRDGATDLVMPSKLTGMLASGKPVVATAEKGSQIENIVKNTGMVVPANNLDKLVSTILKLANDPELCIQLGENARQYAVNHLNKDLILLEFEAQLEELTQKQLKQ